MIIFVVENYSMISYPNAKINIGLDILSKRDDGYHNISSVFYPVMSLTDILEIKKSNDFIFTSSGKKLIITIFVLRHLIYLKKSLTFLMSIYIYISGFLYVRDLEEVHLMHHLH